MKQRFAKTLPLLLAGALQVMPMLRTALPVVTQGFTPSGWAIVLKLAGAAAVFGLGHHAVSAASSLSTPATATVGVAYTGAVTYSGGHAGSVSSWQVTQNWQGATGWSCSQSPFQIAPGLYLTMNPSFNYIGNISGTPTTAGTYSVTVNVWDGICSGDGDTRNFTITVNPGIVVNTPPAVTAQPASRTNNAGTAATFTVTATGTPTPAYRWCKGGVNLNNGGNISGCTTPTLTIANVAASDATNYTVVLTNSQGSITSAVATLTVIVPPAITNQPASRTNSLGSTATFTVGAGGSPAVYRWRKGGVNMADGTGISGSATPTLTLTNITVASATNYDVVLTNAAGNVTSIVAALTVIVPPAITNQPASRTNNQGTTATFIVKHSGSPSVYQWRKGGTNLADGGNIFGATTSTLTLSNVTTLDVAGYDVTIANFASNVTSAVAQLTVMVPPAITNQPASRTNNAGTAATFTVGASGSPSVYRWRKGGVNLADGSGIAGAGTPTLTLTNVAAAAAANYDVLVTNAAGSVTSIVAALTVITPPAITNQPASRTNNQGTTATFAVKYSGSPSAYQWRKGAVDLADGGNIFGATTAMLTLSNVTAADAAGYSVSVANAASNVTSTVAQLTVITPPAVTNHPASRTNNSGAPEIFTVGAGGSPAVYRWRKNGANLADGAGVSGSGTATMTLTNVLAATAGNYDVILTNAAGSTTSLVAVLTVITPPVITNQPASRTNNAGTTATFTVKYTGSPVVYQWRKGGVGLADVGNVFGSTTATLTLSNVVAADAAGYTVTLTNSGGGAVTSAVAVLTVITPSVITNQPASITNNAGTTAAFTVGASGSPAIYRWRKAGVNMADGAGISGSATPILTLTNVSATTAGNFDVLITNAAGSVTSLVAALTVITPPTITNQPASRTNNLGTIATFTVKKSGSPCVCQWRKNGTNLVDSGNISGATTEILTLSNVTPLDMAGYSVVVANAASNVTSAVATLTVITPPSITNQPVGLTNNAKTTAVFTVGVSGSPSVYRWRKNGANLADATGIAGSATPMLTLTNVTTANAANYDVLVTNAAGAVTSAVVVFKVLDPFITSQPVSRTNMPATTATFSVTADGTTALVYRWRKGGVNLADGAGVAGAGTATLTLTNVSAAASMGSYDVIITNTAGRMTSVVATLTVITPPTIASQPASRTNYAGTTTTFTVGISGSPSLYQWRKNGVNLADGGNISGATAATLTLSNVAAADAASYDVTVTNEVGNATSAAATLTVLTRIYAATTNANAGSLVSVPVNIASVGGEGAVQFSVAFDPATLVYSNATLGAGALAAGVTASSFFVNTNQAAQGRLGVALLSGNFAGGDVRLLNLNFLARLVAATNTTAVSFTNSPAALLVVDAANQVLSAGFDAGGVTVVPGSYAGDVNPRPGGDHLVDVQDVNQLSRFVAALDTPAAGDEFRRADCAPRGTGGDGVLTVADWVQAARYAVGADPLSLAGVVPNPVLAKALAKSAAVMARTIQFGKAEFKGGLDNTVSVLLESQGDESGLGLNVSFNPAVLQFKGASLGADATGAALTVNSRNAAAGVVGLVVVQGAGTTFAAGSREVLRLNFYAVPGAGSTAVLNFGKASPIVPQLCDAAAGALPMNFAGASVPVVLPVLNIQQVGGAVRISWPNGFTNSILQARELTSTAWGAVSAPPVDDGQSLLVTLPAPAVPTFYRLIKAN